MNLVILISIFLISTTTIVVLFYYQWKKIKAGKIQIKDIEHSTIKKSPLITIKDILIIILFIVKNFLQFIVVHLLKLYFVTLRLIKKLYFSNKVQKIKNKVKVPKIPNNVKVFIKKSILETRHKINKIKKELIYIEESIEKKID